MIRGISAAEARVIRSMVLRPGQAAEQLVYPGDDEPPSFHGGAFHEDQLVGIASVYPEAHPAYDWPAAWRLRGMATLPEVRGMGYGKGLIQVCLAHIAAHGGQNLWCNGRVNAAGFYTLLGFAAYGDEFITESGPHYVFRRQV
ncbi:MAG: GNAT family N-acetyltransferase [Oscillochloris sp.]|nr:GNAT family N-acetyltransferase [Oscillochloris sp.]